MKTPVQKTTGYRYTCQLKHCGHSWDGLRIEPVGKEDTVQHPLHCAKCKNSRWMTKRGKK